MVAPDLACPRQRVATIPCHTKRRRHAVAGFAMAGPIARCMVYAIADCPESATAADCGPGLGGVCQSDGAPGAIAAPLGWGMASLFGIAAVLAVWLALAQMFVQRGAWFLVSLMALIWFADIAAYFTGKAFGRHKLAPRVSPGKTWEGAAGGVLAATAWVLLSAYWPGSFGDALMQRWTWWVAALIAIFLAALSIVGDLFESLRNGRAGL